jgi:hypothetical protein
MAKKNEARGEGRADAVPASNVRVNDGPIISANRGFDGDSFERGYPGIANEDMHINQGRGRSRLTGGR